MSPSASITCRSGCVLASTRRSSPSRAEANARAAARLPTPAGPWNRYACDGPSASAASNSRFACGCSGTSANVVTNLSCDLVRAAVPVDDDVPLGEALRERPVRVHDPRPELRAGALDPVALVADPRQRGLDVELDEERCDRAAGRRPRSRLRSRMMSIPSPRPPPGRRRPCRGTGRRRRSRRARARVGSRRRRAARGPRGTARSPPTARYGRRGGRGRGWPRRAACRPARASRRRRCRPRSDSVRRLCLGRLAATRRVPRR